MSTFDWREQEYRIIEHNALINRCCQTFANMNEPKAATVQSVRENAEPGYSSLGVPADSPTHNSTFVHYRGSYPPATRTRADVSNEQPFSPINNVPNNTPNNKPPNNLLESIESEESDDQEQQLTQQQPRSSKSQPQQPAAQRQQQQLQQQQQLAQHHHRQQQQQQQQLAQHHQRHQQQQQLVQHQSHGAATRHFPRSTECSDTESFPTDEANILPAAMPAGEPETIHDFAMANDLEEHAYRLINSSRKAARRLREPRSENEWPRQTRQSSISSGLGLRRDSIGGLSTQSQPLVGTGANYSSLGLQSPAPSYRSQGNYAPGVASAVVADMREVLRVREEGMAEHVKLVVTQHLMPLQQQLSRTLADMADMKRDIQSLQTGSQSISGRVQILERDYQNLSASLSSQQGQLMAFTMRPFEGPAFALPTNAPMVNYHPPPFPLAPHLMPNPYQQHQLVPQQHAAEQPQQQHAAEQQRYLPPHQPMLQHYEYALPQQEIVQQQPPPPPTTTTPPQQHEPYLPRPVTQMRQTQASLRFTPQFPQQQSVFAGAIPGTARATASRATSTITSGAMQLQREDIRHLDPSVYGETVGNLPNPNRPESDVSDDALVDDAPSPQLVNLERREVELRRELQDALATKMENQSRIELLQHSLNHINQELNSAPSVAQIRMVTVTRPSMEPPGQQQHHQLQQQQQGEGVVTSNIGGMGPVTDL